MLKEASARRESIRLGGQFSKHLMGGPNETAPSLTISTKRLNRLRAYEPRDLTVSVEAGMPWRKFQRLLFEQRQMAPLDPIYADGSTVGGVVAANLSGPRRRQFGTARDLVIGMQFAMLNGRLVESGGMVVKNVAGLDMAKLMIGSFGTLAAITYVNFKVCPMPPAERTFAVEFATADEAIDARDRLIRGPLQPGAVDLLNPQLSPELGFRRWTLLLWFGGNDALIARVEKEMGSFASVKSADGLVWETLQGFAARFLEKFTDGAVVRISTPLTGVGPLMRDLPAAALSRAASGVTYAYFLRSAAAAKWVAKAAAHNQRAMIEFASEAARQTLELWPSPGGDFEMMRRIKRMFDPGGLLNRGRLYRHI